MILDTLIYDRTQADVDEVIRLISIGYYAMSVEDREKWNTDLKGALNASDLNRVIEATDYVSEKMKRYGYYARFKPLKKSWVKGEIPTNTEMDNYVFNVRQALQFGSDLPLPKKAANMTYVYQNNIEQFLHDAEKFVNNGKLIRIHANTAYAGFQGGLRR